MTQTRSITAFLDPGVYQRLDCGCVMFALSVVPAGPCLCLVENEGVCDREHSAGDFLPMRVSEHDAIALAARA